MRKPFDALAEGLLSANSRETIRRWNFFWGHSLFGHMSIWSVDLPTLRNIVRSEAHYDEAAKPWSADGGFVSLGCCGSSLT